jgi:DNA-binding MarR family transcriptional regulator
MKSTKSDYSRSQGGAAIGARLRRLSESIDRDTSRVYARLTVDFEQRWMGVLNQLDVNGPMSVIEIASALNISHPSVSQTKRSLMAAGLVREREDSDDRRRQTLHFTPKGKALVKKLRAIWSVLDAVAIELNAEAGDPVSLLNLLEEALDKKSILARVNERWASVSSGPPQPDDWSTLHSRAPIGRGARGAVPNRRTSGQRSAIVPSG